MNNQITYNKTFVSSKRYNRAILKFFINKKLNIFLKKLSDLNFLEYLCLTL